MNRFKQEPVQAPSALSTRLNDSKIFESAFMTKFTLTTTEQLKDKMDNFYLFENINKNCLKEDENLINQIYRYEFKLCFEFFEFLLKSKNSKIRVKFLFRQVKRK